MKRDSPVTSDLPYDEVRRLRDEIGYSNETPFDTRLDALTDYELITKFDSKTSGVTVADRTALMTGEEIRDLRKRLKAERARMNALVNIIVDVEDQIDRGLQG